MKIRKQIIAASLGLFLVVGCLIALYVFMNNYLDYSTVNYIYNAQKGPNSFSDVDNSINVHSANDVGYQIKGAYHLNIFYGDMVIDVPKHGLFNHDFMEKLSKIGITIKYNDKDVNDIKYRVEYWGTVVDQYSTVS